ncbi:unnamed protein product [Heligmosomoides polygyrus]|uniref:Transp_Tc5_C domain-containing protein n=1 Tax=Heligmosomoides polygyrus TaxID=6339 RepID=A0A183G9D6_HELPZ|nr:unnamed protein product [Heligmosomoides polygyrus]
MRCAPFIAAANRQNRLLFARQNISTDWSMIVSSDEKKFNCDGPDGFCNYWRDLRKEKLFFSKRNFSAGGVMVWAAICSTVRVKLLFVPKKINSAQYQFTLEHGLLRFWRRNSQRNLIFQQNNAPIHNQINELSAMMANSIRPFGEVQLQESLLSLPMEASGPFPQCGHWSAPNLLIVAGTSHIITKQQVPHFFRESVVGSSAAPLTIVLLDSWHGFRDHENLVSEVPAGNELKLMTILPGATSLYQPLDVYVFRLFKRFIRRFHEDVLHFRPDFNCFSRDNTLKVVSQTYRQFCAPAFRRCFAYAWVTAGYVDTHPGHFSTPADYVFDEVPVDTPCQEASGCSSLAFIRCCWCQRLLCFACFIECYHNC